MEPDPGLICNRQFADVRRKRPPPTIGLKSSLWLVRRMYSMEVYLQVRLTGQNQEPSYERHNSNGKLHSSWAVNLDAIM